jgi:olefin beta-lactone synthetase
MLNLAAADLSATLRSWGRSRPDRAALIVPGSGESSAWRTITFGELDRLVDRYARGLHGMGVREGDRVIFLVRPNADALAVLYALARLRTVPVAIDPGMGLGEMLRCIEHTGARVLFGVPALHWLRLFVRRPFQSTAVFVTDGRRRLWNDATLAECRADTAASWEDRPASVDAESFIFFTSGSTGSAKPVLITSTNIRERLRMVREICGWREGSRVVVCFPSYAPAVLAGGVTAILPAMDFSHPASAPPERIVEAIRTHAAEAVLASPVIWMNLVRHCEQSQTTLRTVRQGITAGAPIPINLHQRLLAVMHVDGTLYTPYGATEALPITSVDSQMLAETWPETRRGGGVCVGTVLRGMRLEVIRITDEPITDWSPDLRVAPGEIGELVVGGPTVSAEYIGLPDANARAKIRAGGEILHRMGDLGRIDQRGRVWFCGRKSDRISTAGRMLFPVTGESIFNEHPHVFRSAIVQAGSTSTQRLVACLEMEKGRTLTTAVAREIAELARGTSWDGVVDHFLQCRVLPVDTRHNSKIRREELVAWASRRLSRCVQPEERR